MKKKNTVPNFRQHISETDGQAPGLMWDFLGSTAQLPSGEEPWNTDSPQDSARHMGLLGGLGWCPAVRLGF